MGALYNNLGKKAPGLALAVDAAVKASLMDGWRESVIKTRKVRLAIRYVLGTEYPADQHQQVQQPGAARSAPPDLDAETDRILALVKNQDDY